jgi:SAM-dependent methyltransferase
MNDTSASPLPSSPAALRNRQPILEILCDALPAQGTVLEIASGTGEHVVLFAKALPHLKWQPSDPAPQAHAALSARIEQEKLSNILPPLGLDVHDRPWAVADVAAIVCINMVHISPWSATEALMSESRRLLHPGGLLYLYGPYFQPGVATVASNIAFDADLRQRNPAWGLRDLKRVQALAAACRLNLHSVMPMPANNFSLLFRRR